MFETRRDWLFEKVLEKLSANKSLVFTASAGWGTKEYVNELGFQLAERNTDIQTCYIDVNPAYSSSNFLELFAIALSHRFGEEIQKSKEKYRVFCFNPHVICCGQSSFFLKLVTWHALIRTVSPCTKNIAEKAMDDLMLHYNNYCQKITENLTPKQLSYLKALIKGNLKS